MLKLKRRIISFNNIFFALILILGWLGYKMQLLSLISKQFGQNLDFSSNQKAGYERLWKNVYSLHHIWENGSSSEEWKLIKERCLLNNHLDPKFKFNDQLLLECHPLILSCIAEEVNKINPENYNYSFEEIGNNYYEYITKENSTRLVDSEGGYLVRVKDRLTEIKLDVVFSDRCREVYLNQGAYFYKEMSFDNYGRDIYIDSYLVTNYDINDWIKFSIKKPKLKLTNAKSWFEPATHLSKMDMENYCAFKGRTLLSSEFYEAGSFWPPNISEDKEKITKTDYRFYWDKIREIKLKDKRNEDDSCEWLYHQGCIKSGKQRYTSGVTSPSWAGLFDVQGGPFEYLRNPVDKDENLRTSSYYFPLISSAQKLGMYSNWNGLDHNYQSIDLKIQPMEIEGEKKFDIGFRCMREAL